MPSATPIATIPCMDLLKLAGRDDTDSGADSFLSGFSESSSGSASQSDDSVLRFPEDSDVPWMDGAGVMAKDPVYDLTEQKLLNRDSQPVFTTPPEKSHCPELIIPRPLRLGNLIFDRSCDGGEYEKGNPGTYSMFPSRKPFERSQSRRHSDATLFHRRTSKASPSPSSSANHKPHLELSLITSPRLGISSLPLTALTDRAENKPKGGTGLGFVLPVGDRRFRTLLSPRAVSMPDLLHELGSQELGTQQRAPDAAIKHSPIRRPAGPAPPSPQATQAFIRPIIFLESPSSITPLPSPAVDIPRHVLDRLWAHHSLDREASDTVAEPHQELPLSSYMKEMQDQLRGESTDVSGRLLILEHMKAFSPRC
ncbi:hypothetical protein EW146_g6391 [Bondarzewia mesenterica]|uniref:Uncharacterized protein n=1 Tax=Bondarzewia mesenterica TaxID=1095465 RepID=A0A4S4LNV1_9AGAM|nr:hypothetical protein EW146_g6391 [Bondarzewia mesenterica]